MSNTGNKQAITIDLSRFIRFLIKRIWILILAVIIGGTGMFIYHNKTWIPTYTASATIYVVNSNPNLFNYEYVSTTDLNTAVQLLDTYMVVIRSNTVINKVMDNLAINDNLSQWILYPDFVSQSLTMASVNNTGVMRISCTTVDPLLSREICNTVVDVAPEEIKRVVGAGSVEVVDYATLPEQPNPRGALQKTLLGAAAGLILACGVLFIIFMTDHRVKDERELEEHYDVPILATILRMDEPDKKSKKKGGKLPSSMGMFLINEKNGDTITESYKNLRTNLRFATLKSNSKLIVVTSSMPNEGKSTVSANLGIVSAQDNQKVILIDGDMRRPSQYKIFDIGERRRGLSTVLLGNVALEDAICKDVRPGLDLLPVGLVPPNPSEMMNSQAMRDLIGELEKQYNLIIMDVPPVNAVTDALVLSDIMAGLVFIVRERYSDYREIDKALMAIEFPDANLLGFVLSGVEMQNRSYYQRKYYYHYYDKYYGHYYHKTPQETAKVNNEWMTALEEYSINGMDMDTDMDESSAGVNEMNILSEADIDLPNESEVGYELPESFVFSDDSVAPEISEVVYTGKEIDGSDSAKFTGKDIDYNVPVKEMSIKSEKNKKTDKKKSERNGKDQKKESTGKTYKKSERNKKRSNSTPLSRRGRERSRKS